MTNRPSAQTNGLVLVGWKTRDRAIALLQRECEFDPPLGDDNAERLWARYRESVNALRGRSLPSAARLDLVDKERPLVEEFLVDASKHGGPIQEVIKVDPLALVAHQLEITTARSISMSRRLQTPEDWAKECLCPTGSAIRPSIRHVPNSVDIDLPHGEWALIFDSQLGLILGEAARCITVTTVEGHLVLWSGYHRSYATAACRAPADRTILAALVDDVGLSSMSRSCGLRAVQSDNPPVFADFFNPELALPVRFKAKRFTMEIRARVVAANSDKSVRESGNQAPGAGNGGSPSDPRTQYLN